MRHSAWDVRGLGGIVVARELGALRARQPQLLASAFTAGKTRIMMSGDSESLDNLLRTLEGSNDLRKQRETLSSVSLTCLGGVSSTLPFKAIQILQQQGIIVDKYVLSPHSVNLFVAVESREAAVRALHSLI
jgi:aspartate kinase